MKIFSFLLLSLCLYVNAAEAMDADQMIAAAQAAKASNGGNNVQIFFKVTDAHAAGDILSSVSSVTFVGANVTEYPGAPTTNTQAITTFLLP